MRHRETPLFLLARGAERNTDLDPRTVPRLRVDGDLPPDQAQPFPHADQAEPARVPGRVRREPDSVITDAQVNRLRAALQFDGSVAGATVLHDIPERLLDDAIK